MAESQFNYFDLCTLLLKGDEAVFSWCQEKTLVLKEKRCELCGELAVVVHRSQGKPAWRCRRPGHPEWWQTAMKHTVFETSHLSVNRLLRVFYLFATGLTSYETFSRELRPPGGSRMSHTTIRQWLLYCRELCFAWLDVRMRMEEEFQIGGDGVVVEIDEAKIGRRKYNRGRLVEGSWIIVMVEIQTGAAGALLRGGSFRVEICPDNERSAEALIPLIQKHVRLGTTIVTDGSAAYNSLGDLGYTHFTINHSQHFVDPATGTGANTQTQTIESQWGPLRREISRGGGRNDELYLHLCEYLWRREMRRTGEDVFLGFIQAAAMVYNPYQQDAVPVERDLKQDVIIMNREPPLNNQICESKTKFVQETSYSKNSTISHIFENIKCELVEYDDDETASQTNDKSKAKQTPAPAQHYDILEDTQLNATLDSSSEFELVPHKNIASFKNTKAEAGAESADSDVDPGTCSVPKSDRESYDGYSDSHGLEVDPFGDIPCGSFDDLDQQTDNKTTGDPTATGPATVVVIGTVLDTNLNNSVKLKKFQCLEFGCNYSCNRRQELSNHSRSVHSDFRPFRCTEPKCSKAFKFKADLKNHMISHTNSKPFLCPAPNCARPFKTKKYLKQHMPTHYLPGSRSSCGGVGEALVLLKCQEKNCAYSTIRRSDLKRHFVAVHSQASPFACAQLN